VPGVPGIGPKTAAQLIGEYGDLETVLARAGEIKQEKRRQSLIDNADKARISKKLVTLDDRVAVEVPIGDLAVHEPDYKKLIAFLKVMEFNSLTRRVAEFSGVAAAEIDADAGHAGGRSTAASAEAESTRAPASGTAPQLPLGRPSQPRDASRHGAPDTPVVTPQMLAAARAD